MDPESIDRFHLLRSRLLTSTKEAFTLFERASEDFLARVYSYFDDIMWPEHALHNEWVGELCAIREFNEEHAHRKICPIHMFACVH